MIILTILFYIFIVIGVINMLHFAAFLIGGNIYDAMLIAKFRNYRKKRRNRYRNPFISVLIPAFNEEISIEQCLESVRKSKYKKFEIIVNNDASTDATASIVRDFQRRHPKLKLRLVNRRHNSGKADGLNYIAKRYARGDLIMTLDADSLLNRYALSNVVKYFDDPTIVGVAANVRIIERLSTLGLLQRFEHMVSYRSKKLYTVINCEMIIGGVASTFRRSILEKVNYYDTDTVTEDIGLSTKIAALGNRQNRLVYAADVVAMTQGVRSLGALLRQRFRWKLGNLQNLIKYRSMLMNLDKKYTRTLSFYRLPMAFAGEIILILEPVVLAYVIYLSVRFLSPSIILGAYGLLTAYLLLVIWPDENLDTAGKIRSSLFAPFMYFLFYIMNFVQLVSVIRCLVNPRRIVSLKKGANTWLPVERSSELTNV